jgi:hypothetical protein
MGMEVSGWGSSDNKKPGAERSARAHVVSFNLRNYADLAGAVKLSAIRLNDAEREAAFASIGAVPKCSHAARGSLRHYRNGSARPRGGALGRAFFAADTAAGSCALIQCRDICRGMG